MSRRAADQVMVRAARRSSEVGVHGACSNCDTGGGAEIARRQIEAEPRAVRSQAEPGNEVVSEIRLTLGESRGGSRGARLWTKPGEFA